MNAKQLIIKNLEKQFAVLNMKYRESENSKEVRKYKRESKRIYSVLLAFRSEN